MHGAARGATCLDTGWCHSPLLLAWRDQYRAGICRLCAGLRRAFPAGDGRQCRSRAEKSADAWLRALRNPCSRHVWPALRLPTGVRSADDDRYALSSCSMDYAIWRTRELSRFGTPAGADVVCVSVQSRQAAWTPQSRPLILCWRRYRCKQIGLGRRVRARSFSSRSSSRRASRMTSAGIPASFTSDPVAAGWRGRPSLHAETTTRSPCSTTETCWLTQVLKSLASSVSSK